MSDDIPGGGERPAKPRQLGRGLSALLGDVPPPTADLPPPRATDAVPVEHLRPGRVQPRRHFNEAELDALAASVKERGILQPILVRSDPDAPGRYEIIAGERRWRAAQRAKLHEVPVIVREMNDEAALEVAIVENVQRQDLNVIEEAEGYRSLIYDFGHTQETLAKAVGKARSHIANIMRLLNLPKDVQELVNDGTLSFGHARALMNVENAGGLARKVARDGLNVRQTERLARQPRYALGTVTNHIPKPKDRDTAQLEHRLGEATGLKVGIENWGERGRVSIRYESLEQLDALIERLERGWR
jgi:ParB family chromosome partitioning protein